MCVHSRTRTPERMALCDCGNERKQGKIIYFMRKRYYLYSLLDGLMVSRMYLDCTDICLIVNAMPSVRANCSLCIRNRLSRSQTHTIPAKPGILFIKVD